MTRPAPLPNGSRSSSFMLPGSSFIWYIDTFTEIAWAGAELGQRQCPQAKDHLDKVERKLSTAPSQGGDLRFLSQLKALRKSFEATCPQQ